VEASTADTVEILACRTIAVARRLVPADHAGITLHQPHGQYASVGASDPLAQRADQLQYELNEGPGAQLSQQVSTLLSAEVARDPRWPRWGAAVAELGLTSVLSAQLRDRGRRLGVLNLYGERPRQFSGEDVTSAALLATHTAVALAAAIEEEQLRTVLRTRTEIGQAQGVLMERFGIRAEQAFAVLRRYSQTSNTKLAEIAAHLVRTRQLPSEPAWVRDLAASEPKTTSAVETPAPICHDA
jgi:GAF domain-containing protein